jgi:hypothetical protein
MDHCNKFGYALWATVANLVMGYVSETWREDKLTVIVVDMLFISNLKNNIIDMGACYVVQ